MRFWLATTLVVAAIAALAGERLVEPQHVLNPAPMSHPVDGLRTGVPYAVAVNSAIADCRLPGDGKSDCLLVVGSLGDPEVTHEVHLTLTDRNPMPRTTLGRESLGAAGFANPRVLFRGERHIRGRKARLRDDDRSPSSVDWRKRDQATESSRAFARKSPPPVRPPASHKPRGALFLHVTDGPLDDARQYARITTRDIAAGTNVRVLADRQLADSRALRRTAAEIVRLFQNETLPVSRAIFGRHCDANGDGRLTIVLTPWLGRLQGGRTSLSGLVRPADFRRDLAPPFGNRCDVLFLNSALRPGPNLTAVLAHEYAHVVTFSRRFHPQPDGTIAPDLDDWLAEGIAHVAESLQRAGWSNLDHRIAAYLRAPQSYPLVVPNYYRAGLWRNHGCRGATFLFLRWCTERYGEGLLRRLIAGRSRGLDDLQACTGCTFPELFRAWSLALAGQALPPDAAAQCDLPGFSSVRLRGTIGRESLHGPAVVEWDGSEPQRLHVRGTAFALVRLRSAGGASRRLRITATPGTRVQLTLLRLPPSRQPETASKPGRFR